MLDGTLVNGRPAWKHTNGRCWIAFEGGIWRGQPEAYLGQKSGFLMLSDEAAASPDVSSATWQAWTGTAWAAQPALKCTVVTAAELSATKAAAAHFSGPCADYCKPLAPCCCVSADGEAIFGCVPTDRNYFLPACLHMALCPQQGCDPKGDFENGDLCFATLVSTLFVCCVQVQYDAIEGGGFW